MTETTADLPVDRRIDWGAEMLGYLLSYGTSRLITSYRRRQNDRSIDHPPEACAGGGSRLLTRLCTSQVVMGAMTC